MLKKSILRKAVAMLAMTAMTLVIVVPALAQGSATEQYDAIGDGTIRGTITEISDSEVFVEEDPSDPIAPTPTTPPTPPDTDKGFFRVTGETEIFDQRGAEQVPATFEDLEVGQLVEATYVGPALVASYPQQGTADSIVILEGPTDPVKPDPSKPDPSEPGTPTDPGTGNGVSDNSFGGMNVLPDTGGLSLALLGAGVLAVIASGLVASRFVRRR